MMKTASRKPKPATIRKPHPHRDQQRSHATQG
jgi:hypothetical protein